MFLFRMFFANSSRAFGRVILVENTKYVFNKPYSQYELIVDLKVVGARSHFVVCGVVLFSFRLG